MSIQIREIVEKFPKLLAVHRGSPQLRVRHLRAAANSDSESLIFVANRQHLTEALTAQAAGWVVHPDLTPEVPPQIQVVLTSPQVQLAMALIAKSFFPQTQHHILIAGAKIHPSAQIAETARLGAECIVGPGAVIGEQCEIGDHCVIGANAVLENNVKVGARTHIHPLVFIAHDCQIGADCEIKPNTTIGGEGFGYAQDEKFNHYRITHYGRVVIEDRVHIGANVQIDRGTYLDSRIGAGTKIDNHCHFGHNIQIGQNTLITGGMITAGSVTLGSYCVFGGRTTIAGHLKIGDKVQISGMSGVTKSVLEAGDYGGFPLMRLKDALKARAASRHLPQMLKGLRSALKKLGLETESLSDRSLD